MGQHHLVQGFNSFFAFLNEAFSHILRFWFATAAAASFVPGPEVVYDREDPNDVCDEARGASR